jgi:hypothetical protein
MLTFDVDIELIIAMNSHEDNEIVFLNIYGTILV